VSCNIFITCKYTIIAARDDKTEEEKLGRGRAYGWKRKGDDDEARRQRIYRGEQQAQAVKWIMRWNSRRCGQSKAVAKD